MEQLNNIKIANHLSPKVEFQSVGAPISYEGRSYQLYVGEKQTPFSKRIASFVKASLATLFTGFIGLCFTSVRNEWSKVFHSTRTVQRYVPVPPPAIEASKKSKASLVPVTNKPSVIKQSMLKEFPHLQKNEMEKSKAPPILQKEPANPELSEKKNEIEKLLKTIQKDAKTDLFLNDDYIEKKYEISSRLASLPEGDQKAYRAKLNQIVNSAYLKQFLRNKGNIVKRQGSEEVVLSYLGKNEPLDKEAAYSAFKTITKKQLKPEHLTRSNASFRQLLNDYALKSRLQTVDITDRSQVAKFKSALSLVEDSEKMLKGIAQEISLTIPPSIPQEIAELGVERLNNQFQRLKSQQIRSGVGYIFSSTIKDHFFDSKVTASSFEKKVKEDVLPKQEKVKSLFKVKCEEAKQKNAAFMQNMNLYAKWGPYLKAEMIQGHKDDNEILGLGVCFAVCFKLLGELQLKPEEEVKDKLSINTIDRFRQALYELKPYHYAINQVKFAEESPVSFDLKEAIDKSRQMSKEFPVEWLADSPFQKENKLFELVYDPEEADLSKKLSSSKLMGDLKQSNGWMAIGMTMSDGGHEVLMRLDQDRQKAWLFDPNMGLLCFEADGKTFDQARTECLACFKDICNVHYPSLYHIGVSQLIPSKTSSQK